MANFTPLADIAACGAMMAAGKGWRGFQSPAEFNGVIKILLDYWTEA